MQTALRQELTTLLTVQWLALTFRLLSFRASSGKPHAGYLHSQGVMIIAMAFLLSPMH